MQTHILTRLDQNHIQENPREIRLFCFVRNEVSRMVHYLDYYRNLGVDRFFFVDNGSTDGTREFLLAQADCHVFHTANSYSEAQSGIAWTRSLLDLFGTGHWCLVMDADELLVYPHCETIRLKQFCDFLDSEGSESVFTFLLDMYPEGSMEDAVCVPGKPFTDITPYFDRDYAFVDRISLKGKKNFPVQEVIGGPRSRCFYKNQGGQSYGRRLFMHSVERGIVALRKLGIPFPYIRLKATPLFKVPLIKWKKGNAYTASTHQLNEVPISGVTGALLHFKFFSDFHEKAVRAVEEGNYAQGSIEYKQYLNRMDRLGNLMYEGSTYYRSSDDLLKAGLIKTLPAFERLWCKNPQGSGINMKTILASRGN